MKNLSVKKSIVVALVLLVVLAACNRKRYVNLITGTWKMSHYIYAGVEQTASLDTTMAKYQLEIQNDHNQDYLESWISYAFRADSAILRDTLSFDSVNMVYVVKFDTLRFVDTTVTPHATHGRWDLVNSEEDLQLRDGSDSASLRLFNILKLTKSNLNMLNGNKEYDLTK